MSFLLPIIIILTAAVIFIIIICYKVARVDQALIITGGSKPKIIRSGGGFVWPIIRKHSYFDLCIKTIVAEGDIIKTKTGVPVVINWTAQIRPNADNFEELRIAATSFLERTNADVSRDIKYTLDGGVREVVSDMSPEAVLREKEEFSKRVRDSVVEEMHNLGFLLVSLNIQEVTDEQGYYDNLAAPDREGRRREAENITADANLAIRERKASTEQAARQAELASVLSIAERTRDMEVQAAEYRAETDRAKADADIAGELQATQRQKDLAVKQGDVAAERQVQFNRAAIEEKKVVATRAEANKVQIEINASAQAEKAKIDADARAAVIQKEAAGKAEADKTAAEGRAEATRREAVGEADAIKATADADAQRISQTGKAEADIIQAKGLAEANAIKAKGLAEADAERALAEARAAHEGVNLKVTLAEIQRDTEVQVSSNFATAMASVGEKAQFIDFGGGSNSNDSDVLTRVLGNIPGLVKKLNAANSALNDEPFNRTINELVNALISPFSALNKEAKGIGEDAVENEAEDPGQDIIQ